MLNNFQEELRKINSTNHIDNIEECIDDDISYEARKILDQLIELEQNNEGKSDMVGMWVPLRFVMHVCHFGSRGMTEIKRGKIDLEHNRRWLYISDNDYPESEFTEEEGRKMERFFLERHEHYLRDKYTKKK